MVISISIVFFILCVGLVFILFKKVRNKSMETGTGVFLGFLGAILIFGLFIL